MREGTTKRRWIHDADREAGMFELKKLTPEGIERALKKVERYRLLNEPWEAESICRDVLAADPGNHEALIALILSLTDQFGADRGPTLEEVRELIEHLEEEYAREYYEGIICERKGTCLIKRGTLGAGPLIYDWLRKAMAHYERAEALRPSGNDDALVRWNSCARLIERHEHIRAAVNEPRVTLLE
ncbi:MAG: hypothetical protein RQ745_09900 [Longimicrobiales bacterium]|nr:hypothetical protein [Longimicrobiales bacterium]